MKLFRAVEAIFIVAALTAAVIAWLPPSRYEPFGDWPVQEVESRQPISVRGPFPAVRVAAKRCFTEPVYAFGGYSWYGSRGDALVIVPGPSNLGRNVPEGCKVTHYLNDIPPLVAQRVREGYTKWRIEGRTNAQRQTRKGSQSAVVQWRTETFTLTS
jgi:hypothetical protein